MALRYLSFLPLLVTGITASHVEHTHLHEKRQGGGGAGGAAAGGGGGGGGNPWDNPAEKALNDRLARLSLWCGGCVLAFFLIFNAALRFQAHIRRLTNLNNGSQKYFLPADPYWAWLKKSVIYAPLFKARHNREFRLSSVVNMGTLPTRFQTFLLLGIIAMNAVLCVITIPWHDPNAKFLSKIRNRSGVMAVVNMIPLMVIAGRNNPLIRLLDVSFDTWNLLHRWFGRIVVLESIVHTLAWMFNRVQKKGWSAVLEDLRTDRTVITGVVATAAFILIALHSFSALRHAFYETFLHLHILFIIAGCVGLWMHLDEHVMSRRFLLAALVVWGAERTVRLWHLLYRNVGNGGTTATVEALPGEAMRITLRIARPWRFKPGQHLYLYMPSVGFWTSHPFTAAWSDSEELVTDEKGLVMTRQDVEASQKPNISLVVRRRTGFTNTLFERAEAGRITLPAFVEGPYGNEHALDSYGTVVLFSAGVGITHNVPYVRHLVKGFADGTVAARRVTLVWVLQSPEHLEWIRPWMTSILAMEQRREVLRIILFITRPRNTREIHSPSSTVQMFPGKPDIPTLLDAEIENQVGAMGVMVCGTGSLSDDVRLACRQRQARSTIDFVEECFTW